MKKNLLIIAGTMLTFSATAQDSPLWMRHCAISPDGTTIAFCYQGDIYTVPANGGKATPLTTNPSYDTHPVWSPDGTQIAFASDRQGGLDIYLTDRKGGSPKRLTTHSGKEMPVTFTDNGHILFEASLMPEAQSVIFPSGQFPQIYEISTEGGHPTLFSSIPMKDISVGENGTLLYHDQKGYEDPWRKHHTSSITRDIWMSKKTGKKNTYTKLTDFNGEDRTPVWSSDGKSYYYLSEKDGTFNVYKRNIDGSGEIQLTHYTKNPVRFLTAAKNGTLCYGYNGEIYTLKEGEQPEKVSIEIISDQTKPTLVNQIKTSGATEIAVAPEGKEIAFILHGDVFVTSADYKTTRKITNTPEQERDLSFSPDGKSLAYSSERNGMWQIYQASLTAKDEKLFTYATDIKEERLTDNTATSFQPQYSPDGKKIAFLENRTTLRIMTLADKSVRTAMDGKYEYSYSDGDQWFEWSPDSRWLLAGYIGTGGWNNSDVALVNASGNGEIYDLTESGYNDSNAKWVLGGKAMIWESDRAGYRSHGSWGAESDVYIMFFDLDAYERFRMSKEELALLEEKEKAEKEEKEKENKDDKEKGKDKGKKDNKQEEVKPLTFDLENCRDRVIRLTVNSSHLGDAVLTEKGDKLYYQAAFEGGFDLWEHDLKEGKTKILMKDIGYGSLESDKDQKHIFMCSNGNIRKIDIEKSETRPVEFEALFDYRPYEEREYIFEHIWKQVLDKFYVTDLHGTDWKGYHDNYRRFLPHINNNYDFQEMLSEMLGELNGSHTGARYSGSYPTLPTACLGVFYDETYSGDGLKIKEIIKQGPFAVKKTDVTEGCIIEKIDGRPILKGMDYYPMLAGKAGKTVQLAIYNPGNGKRFKVAVKAISQGTQNELLYKRWVKRNEKMVEKLSGGRIAYVHVKGMDSPSFRTVYSELLSDKNRNKEAVIVDTRHNGGGWLHDDLATLLSGKEYQRFVPRGQYIGSDPFNKWLKPSCVLVCEDNYSNAHGFPWVYKELKIGKLIGAPVPGTMTAVWWESQIDPTIVFGIPQVGCMDMRGNYMENHQLEPDIKVYNSPEKSLEGTDEQLEAAVKEMLKEADANKK